MRYFTDIFNEVLTWCHNGGDIPIELFDVLFISGTVPAQIYLYEPDTETSTLLSVPNINSASTSSDIAHTENKMWIYQYDTGTFSTFIREYDIILNPFSAVHSKDITGIYSSAGLCAINDTTIICTRYLAGVVTIYETDVSNVIAVNTPKFTLPSGWNVSGDYMLTTTNKLILTVTDGVTERRIFQYDYSTGSLELGIVIDSVIAWPYGLYEYDSEIYIAYKTGVFPNETGEIYHIDKSPPYTKTLVDTTDHSIFGASQIPSQLTTHFLL